MLFIAKFIVPFITFFTLLAGAQETRLVPAMVFQPLDGTSPNKIFIPKAAFTKGETVWEVWQNRDDEQEQIAVKGRTSPTKNPNIPEEEDNIFNRERIVTLYFGWGIRHLRSTTDLQTTQNGRTGMIGELNGAADSYPTKFSNMEYGIGFRPPGKGFQHLYFTAGLESSVSFNPKEEPPGSYETLASEVMSVQNRSFTAEHDVGYLSKNSALSAGIFTSGRTYTYLLPDKTRGGTFRNQETGALVRYRFKAYSELNGYVLAQYGNKQGFRVTGGFTVEVGKLVHPTKRIQK